MRRVFKGPIIAAGGFERDSGDADLVAFGRHFAANPISSSASAATSQSAHTIATRSTARVSPS
ncbi:hypothetical protein [Bradyrhizobium betae]|uniref:NADH:flavin oxidoreductase/NADH oxidase N-terminal domain-containing protein n=1 Tax=Bradyrhizobium betae TaxID=244734 RepID=A0A4Q1UYU4_9BRAD|nr:hypothetical protein [Bradyrhizobium betae]RXT44311.1 hypothetical protein B5V03_22265 [Bradyrhizobium betae]